MNEHLSQPQNSIPYSLFDILEQETKLSRIILDTLTDERTAITKMDMPSLINLSKKKEKQLTRLQMLDKSLQETIKSMADITGAALKDASVEQAVDLAALIPIVNEKDAHELIKHRNSLKEMREEIKSRNHVNKRFAQNVQGYLNDAITLITGSIVDDEFYGAQGAAKACASRPSFISTEV
ncbi:MAG: flagellar protein FlgN [Desulfobulbaceae bacterium]|nr:flagellar protein FlgN [Desulfobulbaceae bacterium]MCK5545049.1 flagellar protein FlgN [Desulfobulbaceae bacterium]